MSGLSFELPGARYTQLSYNIGSTQLQVKFEKAIDSISLKTGITEFCGPVHYKAFNVTDAYQSAINPVSDFVKFDPVTNTLSVWTKDTKIAGTYYLMFDAFLKNYETDPKYPHRKEYMKLILAAFQIWVIQLIFVHIF